MFEIDRPFPIKGLPFKPELTGRPKVDEKLIMTLATLMGWDGESRRLLTCALRGSLHSVSPPVSSITNHVSSQPVEDITFGDIPVTEVMIRACPTNVGDVWVNVGAAAGVDTGWQLDAGDHLKISLNNLSELNLHVITFADMVTIVRAG